MNLLIPFAYNSKGEIIDTNSAVKGTSYLCGCGAEVRLRAGVIYQPHFYHLNGNQCSESSIHKAYKSVFQRIKAIKLPQPINGNKMLHFHKVELEKKINDFIPDAIGYDESGVMHLIEFAKTSYIKERKLNKIKKANVFCLEVSIIETHRTIKEIEDHLLNKEYYKKIVNCLHLPSLQETLKREEKLALDNTLLREELYRLKKTSKKGYLAYKYLQSEGLEYKIGVSLITNDFIK